MQKNYLLAAGAVVAALALYQVLSSGGLLPSVLGSPRVSKFPATPQAAASTPSGRLSSAAASLLGLAKPKPAAPEVLKKVQKTSYEVNWGYSSLLGLAVLQGGVIAYLVYTVFNRHEEDKTATAVAEQVESASEKLSNLVDLHSGKIPELQAAVAEQMAATEELKKQLLAAQADALEFRDDNIRLVELYKEEQQKGGALAEELRAVEAAIERSEARANAAEARAAAAEAKVEAASKSLEDVVAELKEEKSKASSAIQKAEGAAASTAGRLAAAEAAAAAAEGRAKVAEGRLAEILGKMKDLEALAKNGKHVESISLVDLVCLNAAIAAYQTHCID